MSIETEPQVEITASAERDNPHDAMEAMVSDEGKQKVLDSIEDELDDPQLNHVLRMLESSEEFGRRSSELYMKDDSTWDDRDEAEKLAGFEKSIYDNALKTFGYENVNHVMSLREQKGKLEEDSYLTFEGDEAAELFGSMLAQSHNFVESHRVHTFVDGRDLSWIKKRSFKGVGGYESAQMSLYMRGAETFNVPTHMFISAAGFESWRGRHGLKDGRSSEKVITEYAGRDSETAPPVEDSSAILLPDGRMYFLSANSHRVGAAIQRGDEHIRVTGGITLTVLDEVPDFVEDYEHATNAVVSSVEASEAA